MGTMRTMPYEVKQEQCLDCKWHRHEHYSDGWVCTNSESDYYTDWTPADFSCECFEEKGER